MRRVMRVECILGAVVISAAALWAFVPLASQGAPAPAWEPPEPARAVPGPPRPGIDPSAFAATIWNPVVGRDVPQQAQVNPTEQQGAPKFQLIGIIKEGDGLLRAALYDETSDRLLIVGSGDRIGSHTVTSIAARFVELSDGRSATRLALREGRS